MKRVTLGLDAVAAWDNLRLAALKALCGKRARPDARRFMNRLDAHLHELRTQILAGTVAVGRSHQFTIHDPKERLITAPCFGERVLHHAIMNVCEPVFDRGLIADSYACRRGKGRIACLRRAQAIARCHPCFLKLDIRKYFDSIDHQTLNELLSRRFKNRGLLDLFGRIIAAHAASPGRGLPIGSLTSQHFANFYLGGCDRYVKEVLRRPGYVRYMDDMAVWADSSDTLRRTLVDIRAFLDVRLGLAVKPEPYINRTRHGLDFLGCRVLPTHLVLSARSRRRYRRTLRAIERAMARGEMSEEEVQRRGQAVVSFACAAGVKSWRFRRRTLDLLAGEGPGVGAGSPGR
ncbi:Reverse transcriptase (RNA-dependent DNA polymerase) [Gemmata sp. SH-PL17]|uniref:reverse transcriptase/maturase family protein n=1 Tax=Gemmata sp. SH-PL17 TaxID=1630693 RepID=UPI00078E94CC|nr:reverse transcriptase/maturase family protein [Gemmata sp. SH-PL17]AMV24237.1 Reverse transcriptase (RNA-dependent DNA polymerase) [Gemmata sp. SH-PL17]